jgi:hypothetical protein
MYTIVMEPPRETISLLLTSILGGLALTYGVTEIQGQLAIHGFSIPSYSVMIFLIFVFIWLRFLPGNISYIRRLERWPNTSVNLWLFDVSLVTIESMVMIFMAASATIPEMFFCSLLALLLLDIFWLAAMHRGAKAKTRPEPQWIWLWLNIPSAVLIAGLLIWYSYFSIDLNSLVGTLALFIITIVFWAFAIIDIVKSAPDWYGRPRHFKLSPQQRKEYEKYMKEAIKEAKQSISNNGIPVGTILTMDGTIIGRGHNRRVQDGNSIGHAELECLKNAGRRTSVCALELLLSLA